MDKPQSLDSRAKGEGIRGKPHFHEGAEAHCSKNTLSCLSVLEGTSTQLPLWQKENPFRGWQTDKKEEKKNSFQEENAARELALRVMLSVG